MTKRDTTHRCSFTRLAISLLAVALTAAGCSHQPGDIEQPTEPFPVGSTTRFIHDTARPFDAVAGVDVGVRTLITEIWYPAASTAGSRRATYGDYVFGNRAVHQQMMTATTFFHLTPETVRDGVSRQQMDAAIEELFNRQRGSFTDAPVAQGQWPVVVMTHGDAGSRYNMESAAEYLASHGYIVVAPEHTGNSPYSMVGSDPALQATDTELALQQRLRAITPLLDDNGVYGKPEQFGQSYSPLADGMNPASIAALDQSLVERVNDLRATLAQLDTLNRSGPFAQRFDLSRIGLMGRSFGGATTLAGLALEPRFSAGFSVVPPTVPDMRGQLPSHSLIAPPAESVLLAAQGDYAYSGFGKPTLLLMGGEDKLILGLNRQMSQAMGGTSPTAKVPYPNLLQAAQTSGVPAVLALAQNTNHGSFGVAGPYWWPLLKPAQFPQFFDPQQSYQLLDAQRAHQVQAEMALAWFNLQLKANEQGEQTLQANPWQDAGVSLTLFNLGAERAIK
jgi:dienelactone hydrolase